MSAIQKYREEAKSLRKQLEVQAVELHQLRELRQRVVAMLSVTGRQAIVAEAMVHATLERLEQMGKSQ